MVTIEAEMRGVQSCQNLRGSQGLFPRAFRKWGVSWHLAFGLLVSKTERIDSCCCKTLFVVPVTAASGSYHGLLSGFSTFPGRPSVPLLP